MRAKSLKSEIVISLLIFLQFKFNDNELAEKERGSRSFLFGEVTTFTKMNSGATRKIGDYALLGIRNWSASGRHGGNRRLRLR